MRDSETTKNQLTVVMPVGRRYIAFGEAKLAFGKASSAAGEASQPG